MTKDVRKSYPQEKNLRLGKRYLSEVEEEIRQVYISDNRPWVIGYSGGKDSSATTQLVWNALTTLPKRLLKKPVYVISSDTLVETPVIVDHINSNMEKIQKTATEKNLPFSAKKVKPDLNDTFWVNLIGRGYPIPYSRSRWCTDRLKIKPANKFILDKVSQHGEVLVVLGVRKSESATRAQVLSLRSIKGTRLKTHSSLPGAFVYTPIVDFSTKNVWDYLLDNPPPWADVNSNQYLFDLYKSAHDGECPLVIDDTTTSCGKSRFGCWTCTVVTKDHSMESLIESGEAWMKPLLDFRNHLSNLQEPAQKAKYRDHRRRDGKAYFKRDSNEIAWGQTRLSKGMPQELLEGLLKTQIEVQKHEPNLILISEEEIHEIRRLWKSEQSDWLDQVIYIYNKVMNKDLDWVQDEIGTFTTVERTILEQLCNKKKVPFEIVAELLDLERQYYGMSRRANIYKRIDKILRKEWRPLEEILAQRNPGGQN